jgi:putative ATPase
MAINEAQSSVRSGLLGEVPAHLRDTHYAGAEALGHGRGYLYPHDADAGIVTQAYAPQVVQGSSFYKPGSRGFEGELAKRQAAIRAILDGSTPKSSTEE